MAPVFMGNATRPELADELLQNFKDPEIAAAFGTAIFTSDWRKELLRVRTSCLILQSQTVAVVPAGVGKYLESQIAGARLQTLATEGHFPHLSAPDRVVQSIRQFVALQPPKHSTGTPRREPRSKVRWPAGDDPDLRLRAGIWSRRLPPIAGAVGRAELEELLLKRVGELYRHIGRYDMHALTIASWLSELFPSVDLKMPVSVRTRGSHINKLLERASVELSVFEEFEHIDKELRTILDRHEMVATNRAVVPALIYYNSRDRSTNPDQWYEYDSASDQELLFFIDVIERDVLQIAALCVRLSTFAESLQGLHGEA